MALDCESFVNWSITGESTIPRRKSKSVSRIIDSPFAFILKLARLKFDITLKNLISSFESKLDTSYRLIYKL